MQLLRPLVIFCVALTLVLTATAAYSVEPGRLWLPKKYQYAMAKLENTAYLAGATPRCTEVIAGKIDHSKSSADNFRKGFRWKPDYQCSSTGDR